MNKTNKMKATKVNVKVAKQNKPDVSTEKAKKDEHMTDTELEQLIIARIEEMRANLKKLSTDYKTGWVCPKCGRVNSPDTVTCPCSYDFGDTWICTNKPIFQDPTTLCGSFMSDSIQQQDPSSMQQPLLFAIEDMDDLTTVAKALMPLVGQLKYEPFPKPSDK